MAVSKRHSTPFLVLLLIGLALTNSFARPVDHIDGSHATGAEQDSELGIGLGRGRWFRRGWPGFGGFGGFGGYGGYGPYPWGWQGGQYPGYYPPYEGIPDDSSFGDWPFTSTVSQDLTYANPFPHDGEMRERPADGRNRVKNHDGAN